MNSHKHARLTAKGRALLVKGVVEHGWTARAASDAAGVSVRTGFKWLARFREEGEAGLSDRSSRPRRCPPPFLRKAKRAGSRCAVSAGPNGASPPRRDIALPRSAGICAGSGLRA